MAMDLYAKGITLFGRINDFASKTLLKAEKRELLKAEIEELEKKVPKLSDQLAEEKRREGSLLYSEEKVKAKQEEILANALAIATKKEELAAAAGLPEVKFSYNSEQDRKLKKEWTAATTSAMRVSALANWFAGYGVPGVRDSKGRVDVRIIELEDALHHGRVNSLPKIVLDGENWARGIDAGLSMRYLYAWCVDLGFEYNQMKADLYSETLKDMFQKHRDDAKARREAKKAKKNQK